MLNGKSGKSKKTNYDKEILSKLSPEELMKSLTWQTDLKVAIDSGGSVESNVRSVRITKLEKAGGSYDGNVVQFEGHEMTEGKSYGPKVSGWYDFNEEAFRGRMLVE